MNNNAKMLHVLIVLSSFKKAMNMKILKKTIYIQIKEILFKKKIIKMSKVYKHSRKLIRTDL